MCKPHINVITPTVGHINDHSDGKYVGCLFDRDNGIRDIECM